MHEEQQAIGAIVHLVMGAGTPGTAGGPLVCRPAIVLGQAAYRAARERADAARMELAAAQDGRTKALAAHKKAQSAVAQPVAVGSIEEAEAAIRVLERAEDAAGAVTDAESRLKAAQAGVARAEELLAAAATRRDLVVFLGGEADARLVGERLPNGAGGMLTVPLTVYRAGVPHAGSHDASGGTGAPGVGTWHTAAECELGAGAGA